MKKYPTAGRPAKTDFERINLNQKISRRELKSLERITGLNRAKALRYALTDFIIRNGGYSNEE